MASHDFRRLSSTSPFRALGQRMSRREKNSDLQAGGISRDGTRVTDDGHIWAENGGSFVLSNGGRLSLNGGLIEGNGISIGGATTTLGPTNIVGDLIANYIKSASKLVGAELAITGAATVNGNLIANYIKSNSKLVGDELSIFGNATINGEVVASYIRSNGKLVGSQLAITGSGSFSSNVTVNGTFYASGTKNFRIPHPTRPGHWLVHAATESPVAGIEYWGTTTIGDHGETTVELPHYFEAIAAPDTRAVLLTPTTPLLVGASIPAAGRFTITGAPGTVVSWQVKARRADIELDVEPLMTKENE